MITIGELFRVITSRHQKKEMTRTVMPSGDEARRQREQASLELRRALDDIANARAERKN